MKCLLDGRRSCGFQYESWRYSMHAQYAELEPYGASNTIETTRILVGYKERLHIYLFPCLLGRHYRGGHLVDVHGQRMRVWISACETCDDLGWYPDHDDSCLATGYCSGCPIQRPCTDCSAAELADNG